MSKGKRRAQLRAEKVRRKKDRYGRAGAQSTYARKRRGELVPDRNTPAQVWCAVCYRHLSLHDPKACTRPRVVREYDDEGLLALEAAAA
jgi:hypothetical protein